MNENEWAEFEKNQELASRGFPENNDPAIARHRELLEVLKQIRKDINESLRRNR